MSSKFSHRQIVEGKVPRNSVFLDMVTSKHAGGPMRDRRERRPKDAKRSWKNDWDDFDPDHNDKHSDKY